jgi:hypothetical protein
MNQPDNTGPNLKNIKKEQPFKVPDGYFEDFTARLNDRIHAPSTTAHVKIFALVKPYVAAAVILIIALIAGSYYYRSNKSRKATERFYTEVSQEIERDLYSFSDEFIFQVMMKEIPENSISSSLNTEDVINYLLNEDLVDEELTDEL